MGKKGSHAKKRAREKRGIVLKERKERRNRECGRNSPHAITLFLITV